MQNDGKDSHWQSQCIECMAEWKQSDCQGDERVFAEEEA